MILQGLYHLIATKRAAAGAAARTARECEAKDPRMAHECNETAERLAIEAEEAAEHAKGNEEMMEGIMHRENGDREPERNFEIVPPAPAINGQAVS